MRATCRAPSHHSALSPALPRVPTRLAFLVLVWFAANLAFNVGMERSLGLVPNVHVLTTFQFAAGTLCYGTMLLFQGATLPHPKWAKQITLSAVLLLGGTLFTNVSLSLFSVSFTHVIKTCEPFFTVVIVYLWDRKVPDGTATLALVVTVLGVLAASADQRAHNGKSNAIVAGVGVGLAANLCLQMRNVLNKKLMVDKEPTVDREDNSPLIVTMPAEGAEGAEAVKDAEGEPPPLKPMELLLSTLSVGLPMQLALHAAADMGAALQPESRAVNRYAHYGDASLLWLVVPPAAFVLYQVASISVLARVDPVSHALLNATKRVVVIGLGAMTMREPFSPGYVAGAALALIGVSAYSFAKTLRSKAAHLCLCCSLAGSALMFVVFWVTQLPPAIASWGWCTGAASHAPAIAATTTDAMGAASFDYTAAALQTAAKPAKVIAAMGSRRSWNGMRIAFVHRHTKHNLGDFWSTPYHYFDWPQANRTDMFDIGWGPSKGLDAYNFLKTRLLDYDVVIVGGGGLLGLATSAFHLTLDIIARHPGVSVIWAAGTNYLDVGTGHPLVKAPEVVSRFKIAAIRDQHVVYSDGGDDGPEVPQLDDATCMHAAFDRLLLAEEQSPRPAAREIKVVVFEHSSKYATKMHRLSGLNLTCPESENCEAVGCVRREGKCVLNVVDRLHNEGYRPLPVPADLVPDPLMPDMPSKVQTIEGIIERLSKADVVVTSSYHGCWWATLLGKAVVVSDAIARSSRVKLLRYPPTAYSGNLYRDQRRAMVAAVAHPFPETLRTCRRSNELFYDLVMSLATKAKAGTVAAEGVDLQSTLDVHKDTELSKLRAKNNVLEAKLKGPEA